MNLDPVNGRLRDFVIFHQISQPVEKRLKRIESSKNPGMTALKQRIVKVTRDFQAPKALGDSPAVIRVQSHRESPRRSGLPTSKSVRLFGL